VGRGVEAVYQIDVSTPLAVGLFPRSALHGSER